MEITSLAPAVSSQNLGSQGVSTQATSVNSADNQVAATAVVPTDTLSITSSKSIVVQQVVTQQVEIALELGSTGSSTISLSDNADQLSNKILQKIDDDVAKNESDHLSDKENYASVVKNVSVKIEQGFQQATTVLNSMGILDESAVNDVQQIRKQVNGAVEQAASGSTLATVSTESSSFNAVSASRDLSSSIQITTKEGDVVTIDLSLSQALDSGRLENTDRVSAFAKTSSSTQLSISVQGELSDEERESIRDVVKSVNKMAEKLLTGKTGAAMEKLSELGINTEQLATMSLSMSSSISYAAVSAYTQVSTMSVEQSAATPLTTSSNLANNQATVDTSVAVQAAKPVTMQSEMTSVTAMKVTNEIAEDVRAVIDNDSLKDAGKDLRKLFAQLADVHVNHEHRHISKNHNRFIKELFDNVVSKVDGHRADKDNEEKMAPLNIAA